MDSKSQYNFAVDIKDEDWLEKERKDDEIIASSPCSDNKSPTDKRKNGGSDAVTSGNKTKKGEKAWRWSMGVACIILGIIVSLLFKIGGQSQEAIGHHIKDVKGWNDLAYYRSVYYSLPEVVYTWGMY